MSNNLQQAIEQAVHAFQSQIAQISTEYAKTVLGSVSTNGHTNGKSNGNGKFKPTFLPGGNLAKGEKRDPAAIEALQSKFMAFVSTNEGLRIEQINKSLGTTTKDLQLPIRKLIAEKKLKVKGEKRSTQYFTGSKA